MTALMPITPAAQAWKQVQGEVLGPEACVRVIGLPHPFSVKRLDCSLPAGQSVEELLRAALGFVPFSARVVVGMGRDETWRDEEVPKAWWGKVRPKPGSTVTFRVVPMGGGSIMRTLLLLAVVVAAAFLAPYLATVIGAQMGLVTGSLGMSILQGVIGMAISAIGNMLVNALFPVKPPKISSAGDSGDAQHSISGARNQAAPWDPVPVVMGRHRVYPKYAANPWTEIVGDEQYLRLLFCIGFGPLKIEDLRIGTTPVANFTGIEIEIREGRPDDLPTSLYPNQAFQSTFDILLTHPEGAETGPDGPWYTRTTAEDITEICIDIAAPRGLFKTDSDGKRQNRGVTYRVEYSVAGAEDWLPCPAPGFDSEGLIRQDRSSMQPLRWGHPWTVPEGKYDVRVKRWSNDERQPRLVDEIRWTALRAFKNEQPIRAEKPLCLVAMRVQASDQLNGVIDTFNCIATSILPDWDVGTESWIERETRNPASMFRAVLQGPANARPVADEDIDLANVQAFHEKCTAEGWTFDQVRDYATSAYDALTDIASAGRAAVLLRDAQWAVMWPEADAPVVQHFTPRNSWGFQSERAYREFPHAWRVRFVNSANDFQEDERIVYDAGYSKDNATKFEALQFPGVTQADLIWRHGRFHLAQARLQPETYSFNADFEGLVCTRGDRIKFNHDIPLFGRGAGRVSQTYAGGLTVPLDDLVGMEPGKNYCMRFRTSADGSLLFGVVTEPGEFRSVTLIDPGSSPLILPQPGDLFMFGEVGSESVDLVVKSIEPQNDFAVLITCVDYAPAILLADSGEIPPFDSQVSPPLDLRGRIPPGDLRFSEHLERAGPAIQSVASLSWQRPTVSGPPPSYEVQYRISGGVWSTGAVTAATAHSFINLTGATYDFRVRTLGPNNTASDWAVLAGQPLDGLLAPPQTVTGFRIQIIGALATLSWTRNPDLDLSHYEIRHFAATTGAAWQNALVLAANVTGTTLQVPALAGTYLIKAVDTSGVYSLEPALILSSVAAIAGLNVVEVLDEADGSPIFPGLSHPETVNVRLDDILPGIRLDDVDQPIDDDNPAIEGIYHFSQDFSLGAIYTSRLTVTAQVQGFDTEDNFLALENVLATDDILGAAIDDYEVEVQARWTSGDINASPVPWSDWTPLLVADVTASDFQFRAVLRSLRRHVTPIVTGLLVTIDMPDRIAAAEDVAVPDAGVSFDFDPPFKATPAVVVTVQDAQQGDYWEVSNKSAAGFDLIVKNSAGTGVSRVVDWHAQGYGEERV